MTRKQFGLSTLFALLTLAALFAAFIARPNLIQLTVLTIGLSAISAVLGKIHCQRPVLTSTLVGIACPWILIIFDAAHIVATNQRFQGQLYDEDGPAVFFIKTTLILLIFGVSGMLLGNAVGWIMKLSFAVVEELKFQNNMFNGS